MKENDKVYTFQKVIGRILFFLYPYKIALFVGNILNKFYSLWISNIFASSYKLSVLGRGLKIAGGDRIFLGEENVLVSPLRLEAIKNSNGKDFAPKIVTGNGVKINAYCHIGCLNEIYIGEGTSIGERTLITDHMHNVSDLEEMRLSVFERPLVSKGKVIIGEKVHIGEGCIILPGVTIGNNSIVGANSVVTSDIPSFSIAAGNPARVIKTITG